MTIRAVNPSTTLPENAPRGRATDPTGARMTAAVSVPNADASDAIAGLQAQAMPGTVPPPPLDTDRLIRRMVHDMRGPLRAAAIIPGWIREDLGDVGLALPHSLEDHLRMLERQAARMDGFLTGLQALCKAGDPSRMPDRVDPASVISRVIAEMQARPGIQIHFERDLPGKARDGDDALGSLLVPENDFAASMYHLIHNAQQHHDRDQGRVIVRAGQNAGRLTIEVADDGPGIRAGDQARVFEPFTTLFPRDEVEGAGLGLAIAARLARAMAGELTLFSAGRGTLMRLELPAAVSSNPARTQTPPSDGRNAES